MVRVDEEDFDEVKKQIKRCCNYIDKQCILLDGECPQMITLSLCCKWFRNAVLPENQELYNLIYYKDKLTTCKCGKRYLKTGNRQIMCPECAKENRRKKKREYNRRQYNKSE